MIRRPSDSSFPATLSALALSLFLVACGGSSGGGSPTPDSDDENTDNGGDNGDGGDQGGSEGTVDPTFTNIAVHDPSVIKVEGEYYVIGSHLSAAKTDDLMNWERVADGVTPSPV